MLSDDSVSVKAWEISLQGHTNRLTYKQRKLYQYKLHKILPLPLSKTYHERFFIWIPKK